MKQMENGKQKLGGLIAENNMLSDRIAARKPRENTLQQQIDVLENRRGVIEEKLPLRDRIKRIFKKYGFTATAIVTAVGVVIGVIISSLKSGLSSVAQGLGKGLKTIGEKLAHILPGMVGAIASFIFKTAGQVVGFLAKHAWLLIVAVVLYVVERYKK